MKNSHSLFRRGFTLVELLVVIAIIAVLAAAGFGAGNAAIQKARRLKAQTSATAMDTAVNMFFTEYSSMPVSQTADTDVQTTASPGQDMIKVLLGVEANSTSMLNTKSIKFLNVKEGKGNKDGLMYSSGTPGGLYDPWGGPYGVLMDCDADEKITLPGGAPGAGTILNNRRVATWTLGLDKATGSGKNADDVKTY